MSNPRPKAKLSAGLQRGMAMKAAAYTALSAGCWPIGGLLIRPDLSGILAVFGLAFSVAALLAVFIYRRGSEPQQARALNGALVLLILLGTAQLFWVVRETRAQFGASSQPSSEVQPASLSS